MLFFSQLSNHWLLIGIFKSFIFNVIIEILGLRCAFFSYLLPLFLFIFLAYQLIAHFKLYFNLYNGFEFVSLYSF